MLTVPARFGLPVTYVSAGITGVFLIGRFVFCVYACCTGLRGPGLARYAVLPLVGALVLSTHYDFVHYSSEHLPLFFTGLSLFILTRLWLEPDRFYKSRMFSLGAATGGRCFTKLQFAPIAATLAAVAYSTAGFRGGAS